MDIELIEYCKTKSFTYIDWQIKKLQDKLSQSDYKIIKNYEYSLVNKDLPYNLEELNKERQSIRDTINELQTIFNDKYNTFYNTIQHED